MRAASTPAPSRLELVAGLERHGNVSALAQAVGIPRTTVRRLLVPAPVSSDTQVLMSDQHCPHHDPALLDAACALLDERQPAEILLLGDGMDLPTLSRHRGNPLVDPKVGECITSYRDWVTRIRQAAPHARIRQLWGNHEIRLDHFLLDNASPIIGSGLVRSLEEALRFDDLGVEVVDHDLGSYPHAFIEVVPGELYAIHGTAARKGAGNSVKAEYADTRQGTAQGHCHRLYAEEIDAGWDYRRQRRMRRWLIETGHMTNHAYHGYAKRPDWQAGFIVLTVRPDDIRVTKAVWDETELRCGDRTYYALERPQLAAAA